MERIYIMKGLICGFLCCVAVAGASDVQLRVVRKGKDIALAQDTALTTNVIALIESCTVHTSTYQSGRESERPEIWAKTLGSDSFIQVRFAKPARLRFEAPSNHGREDYSVDEILVGLPEGKWAQPFLVRTGRNVHTFGKYDARVLKRVVFEPALELSSVRPYSDLAKFEDQKP
jgi:hypothetical protein